MKFLRREFESHSHSYVPFFQQAKEPRLSSGKRRFESGTGRYALLGYWLGYLAFTQEEGDRYPRRALRSLGVPDARRPDSSEAPGSTPGASTMPPCRDVTRRYERRWPGSTPGGGTTLQPMDRFSVSEMGMSSSILLWSSRSLSMDWARDLLSLVTGFDSQQRHHAPTGGSRLPASTRAERIRFPLGVLRR